MTRRDNFHRMMRGQGALHLPIDLPMTSPVLRQMKERTGCDSATDAFDLDFRSVGIALPRGDPQAWRDVTAALGFVWPDHCEVNAMGFAHVRPPVHTLGKAYHLTEMIHPLSAIQRVEQLDSLPWPDYDDAALGAELPEQVRRAHAEGRAAVANMECTVFEHAWYARGMDNLFMDLAEGNGIADWLLDWHTHRSCVLATAYSRAGADVIGLGDDVGTQHGMMMAPDYWRQHLKPRLARVIDTIRRHQGDHHVWIRYHSDGDIRDIIDDLIEIGVDILNPMQPECMPVDDLIVSYRQRLAFWGMVGTQTTMPFGTTDAVRDLVAHLAEHARQGAALVVAPTHVLEPDVPWDNIVALVDAVRQTSLSATVKQMA